MGFSNGHFTTDSSGGGTGTGDKIQTIPSSYVAAITAGENLTIRDAVCLDLDGSGDYRVYKADYTLPNRRNACGFATATVSTGAAVTIHRDGPLGGFTGLTKGTMLYVGNTAGAITAAPTDTNPVLIGQAVGTDTVWAFPISRPFATPAIFIVSHGSTAVTDASGTNTSAAYNFTSWSSSVSDSVTATATGSSESALLSSYVWIDGRNTSSVVTAATRVFNKTSWGTGANRGTPKEMSSTVTMSNTLYSNGGYGSSAYQSTIDAWNATSWTALGNLLNNTKYGCGSFYQGGTCHVVGGYNGTYKNDHDSFNGSTVSVLAVFPLTDLSLSASRVGSSGVCSATTNSQTNSYVWSGSWSANIPSTYGLYSSSASAALYGPASGFANAIAISCGGTVSGSTSLISQQFNGVAWSASTSMSTAKTGLSGGCC
jgi:hypothetical protein